MNEYYIYCYYDTRVEPNIPIYIGRGKNKRYIQHYKKTHNRRLKFTLDKIKEDTGSDALVKKLEENLTNDQANEKEIYYISLYGRSDLNEGSLFNLSNGGETNSGWKASEETKKLWSSQRKGKKQTPAQYAANCNRIITEEHKKRLIHIGHQFENGVKKSKSEIIKSINTKISKRPNLVGQRFGKLIVLEDTNESHRQKYICQCDCGSKRIVLACELKRNKYTKCNKLCYITSV